MPDLVQEVRRWIAEVADPQRAPAMAACMKSAMPFRGVPALQLAAHRRYREFRTRKAIGWALREHAKTDAGWVRGYVEEPADRLPGLSRREALKHLGG